MTYMYPRHQVQKSVEDTGRFDNSFYSSEAKRNKGLE